MLKKNLYGLHRSALKEAFDTIDFEPYRAKQAFRWMYERGQTDVTTWTDFSKVQRETLLEHFEVSFGPSLEQSHASDGTVKHRIQVKDGNVEAVFMPYEHRHTFCISSQVGCALGCKFCLTATMGFQRNLSAGEILGQVALLLQTHPAERPPNLVFMGMGEPLHNYDAVLQAFQILVDPEGFGLARRRITISTVGLADKIEKLAMEEPRPRLAVSLNATTNEIRDQLMPVNRKFPLERLVEAVRSYSESQRDDATFEYVLLDGINDSDQDVSRLHKLAHHAQTKINLIPFNEVPNKLPYRSTPKERVLEIRDLLLRRGSRASIRWSKGRDALAACGQLALES